MSGTEILEHATLVALMMIALALFLTVWRIVVGPTLANRILALDLLAVEALAFVAVFSVRSGLTLFLDIAIALALLGFLATTALARYLMTRRPPAEHDEAALIDPTEPERRT